MNLALQVICSDKLISKEDFGEKSYCLNDEVIFFPPLVFLRKKKI